MFTGIIQNQAKVIGKIEKAGQVHFVFRFQKPEKRALDLGESIAVNGVCLTVAKKNAGSFEVDCIRETLKATTLSDLKIGDWANAERALRYGDKMGGHFVSGHVDGVGKIAAIEKDKKNRVYWIETPVALRPLIAIKGSVVVDGISLTVQEVTNTTFSVSLVPHTLKVTQLSKKKRNDRVNLEADLIARYLLQIQQSTLGSGKSAKKPLSLKTLKAAGF